MPTGMPHDKYGRYRIEDERLNLPGPTFVDELLTLMDQGPGTTIILADQPKNTYYVATRIGENREPREESFYLTYKEEVTGSPFASVFGQTDSLYRRFLQERQDKYRADFIQQLRADAGLSINPEGRKLFEGSGDLEQ
jgi:hypothetical protein